MADDATKAISIPAATLIVFARAATPGEPPPLLFVQRSPAMRFAPGAIVFPGGQVDAADLELGTRLAPALEPADAGARVAAIRETLEETGLAIGLDCAVAAEARERLAAGERFADIVAALGVRLTLDALHPFARWHPRFPDQRSFDTRFYVAELAGPPTSVTADGQENVRAWWESARDALAGLTRGSHRAIFPTYRNIERLAALDSAEAARAQANETGTETITPWVESGDDGRFLCIPRNRGYPVTRVPLDAVDRGRP